MDKYSYGLHLLVVDRHNNSPLIRIFNSIYLSIFSRSPWNIVSYIEISRHHSFSYNANIIVTQKALKIPSSKRNTPTKLLRRIACWTILANKRSAHSLPHWFHSFMPLIERLTQITKAFSFLFFLEKIKILFAFLLCLNWWNAVNGTKWNKAKEFLILLFARGNVTLEILHKNIYGHNFLPSLKIGI